MYDKESKHTQENKIQGVHNMSINMQVFNSFLFF